MDTNAKRYAIYARKSTEDSERQVISIATQVGRSRERFGDLNIAFVIEEEKSAFIPDNRPKFSALLNQIEQGEIDGLLAYHPDRLARNEIDGARLTYMLRRGQLKDLRFDTYSFENSAEGIMYLQLAFSQSQYSSAKLSRDVSRGLDQKRKMGLPPGLAPEGYLNNKQKPKGLKDWRKDSKRFPLVAKMWELFLARQYSVSEIRRIANEQWGYHTVRGARQGNQPLGLSTLYRIFSNIKYAGHFYWNGELHRGRWQPMISLDQFDQAQEMLGGRSRPRPKHLFFPYGTGLIRCGQCGGWITAEQTRKFVKGLGRTRVYSHYHCTHRKGNKRCRQKSLTEQAIEERIESALSSIQMMPEFVEWADNVMSEREKNWSQGRDRDLAPSRRMAADLEKKLDQLKRGLYQGQIDHEFFVRERKLLSEELAHVKDRLTKVAPNPSHLNNRVRQVFAFAAQAPKEFRTASPERKRQIALALSSNYRLKDKDLRIEPEEWFKTIAQLYPSLEKEFRRFVPPRSRSQTGSTHMASAHALTLRPRLSGFVEEVRKKVALMHDLSLF